MARADKDKDEPRCPHCGEEILPTDGDKHRTVERVVRQRNRYGLASAGQSVLVEARHADQPSVTAATMSLAEAEAARVAAAQPALPKVGRLKSMVEAGIAAAQSEVRQAIERGKARRARDAERAADAVG